MSIQEEKTIVHILQDNIKKYGEKTLAKYKKGGVWCSASWNEFGRKVKHLSLYLISIGLNKGDKVCLLSGNRPEWAISDFGILSAGLVTVPIYATLVADDVAYIINHSEAKVIIVENETQLNKVESKKNELPNLQKIIIFGEYKKTDNVITLDEALRIGEEYEKANPTTFEKCLSDIQLSDIATIVYTSGTTGPPKGSMITHSNIMYVCRALDKIWQIGDGEVHLSYLPLAHVYERMGAQFYGIMQGGICCYAQSYDTLKDDIQEAKPTLFLGVPRVYEKVYQGILANIEKQPPLRKKIFNWATSIGRKYVKLEEQNKKIPFSLRLKYKIADRLVFSKIKHALGGKVKYLVTSAAPLATEIQEFFNACGLRLYEGWGLTETTAPVALNTPTSFKIGTLGKPLPGTEVKIADDGEILVRGGGVFQGYYKEEEMTKEVLKDGWFHTGDIGEIDEDGFVKITDRKKDIIITAGGKNVAPQNIENLLKTDSRITEAVVIGDRKPYLTALLILNREEVEKYAKEKGIEYTTYEGLVKTKEIQEYVQQIVDEKNKKLAKFETIKKFTILPQPFSIETGELTPTLKVKRRVVNKKFSDIIEEMYKE